MLRAAIRSIQHFQILTRLTLSNVVESGGERLLTLEFLVSGLRQFLLAIESDKLLLICRN